MSTPPSLATSNRYSSYNNSSGEEIDDTAPPARKPPAAWVKVHRQESPATTPTMLTKHRHVEQKPYKLCDVSEEKMADIRKLLERHPEFTANYDFQVRSVTHKVLDAQFENKIAALSLADNQALIGSWQNTQEKDIRSSVIKSIDEKKKPTQSKNVYTLTAFHATKTQFQSAVLRSGLHALAKTDQGYFGQGIYFTTYPEYSVLYGGREGGVILICEIAFRTLFPVATCDELMGRPIKTGFDGHAVHVVPKTDNPKEMMYVCRAPEQKAKFDEIVVHDASQTVIRYVLEYKPKTHFAAEIKENRTRKSLGELLETYIRNHPFSDQIMALSEKLDVLDCSSETPLDSGEVELYTYLQRSKGEDDASTIRNLEERMQRLLLKDDAPEFLITKYPASFLEDLESKEKKDPDLESADAYFNQEDYRKALLAYKKALETSGQSFRANVGCGKIFFREQNWEKVIFHFKEALKIKPTDQDACVNYVYALLQRVKKIIKIDSDAAARDLHEALQYQPTHPEALALLASIYFQKDAFNQAYCMATRALQYNPQHVHALRVRGAYYTTVTGREQLALADLNKSLELQPNNNTFALLYRARLCIALGDLHRAEEDCNSLLKKDKNSVPGLLLMAKTYLKLKKTTKAEKELKKIKSDSFIVPALCGEVFFQKSNFASALEKLNESIELYREWSRKEQRERVKIIFERDRLEYYDILLLRAEVHSKRKAIADALSDFEAAIMLFPNKPEAYQGRGTFYQNNSDPMKAKEDFQTAEKLKNKE